MLDLMQGQAIAKPVPYLRTLVREFYGTKGDTQGDFNARLRSIDVPDSVSNPQRQEATT